jgi:cytochrome c5
MQRLSKRALSLMVWSLPVWMFVAPPSQGLIAAQVSPSASSDQQAQSEKGRLVIGQVCASCHTTIVRMIQVHKRSAEEWRDIVYHMISRGAQVMPDEIEPVVAFLAANAGNDRQTVTQTSTRDRPMPARADQVRDGEGRAIFQRSCQQCHDLATASAIPSSEEWSAVIARMVSYGAALAPAEQQALTEYLNGLAR